MDVLELAKHRRAALAKEVGKLEQFIALGEELGQSGSLRPSQEQPKPETTDAAAGEKPAGNQLRQYSAGGAQKD